MVAVIHVERVSKRYGAVAALDAVNLEIAQGEFFGLLGANGAGKTTLINVLTGLVIATRGTARVMGFDVIAELRASGVEILADALPVQPFLLHGRRLPLRIFRAVRCLAVGSLAIVGAGFLALSLLTLHLIRIGYKLRH